MDTIQGIDMKKFLVKIAFIVFGCLGVALIPAFFGAMMDMASAEMSLIKIKFLARLCLFILFVLAVIHVTQRNR